LEGNIGVGKSTLCQKFEVSFPDDCSSYKEQTNDLFLKLFYSDPKVYGFAFQWGMLKSRIYQLKLAQHDYKHPENPPKKYYFWDRSMIGDYMFALWNHLLGSISREEMDVYESEFGGNFKSWSSIPFLKDIHCFVMLNDEPANCKWRVEITRKNESEQGIPLSYYEGIDDIHFNIFMKLMAERIGPVAIMTFGQYHDARETYDAIDEVVTGKKKSPSVTYLDSLPQSEDIPNDHRVYTNEEEIVNAYLTIKKGGTQALEKLKAPKCLYLPHNIMRISAKAKRVIENDYGIIFFQEEYKRVVLWHLSQFQDVCFY